MAAKGCVDNSTGSFDISDQQVASNSSRGNVRLPNAARIVLIAEANAVPPRVL